MRNARSLLARVCNALFAFGVALLVASRSFAAEPELENGSAPARDRQGFVDNMGVTRDFHLEYRRALSDNRYEPRYDRAALEDVVVLAVGTLQYWSAWKSNRDDWDAPSLEDRLLFRGIRFDNNTFTTNQLLHPAAGLGYYVFPRANGVTMPVAILYTQFGAVFWEYALEWRELVSFNDLVFTPVAGIAGGEFTFHLADYLNTAPAGSVGAAVGQAIFGFPVRLQTWFDGQRFPKSMPKDNLGLSSAYWHRFAVIYHFADNVDQNGHHVWLHGVTAEAKLISMPGFLRPGAFDVFFADGNFSEARGRLLFGPTGLEDSEVWVNTSLVGYYAQNFSAAPGGIEGVGGMVGVGTAFSYLDRIIAGDEDQVAAAHFVGTSFGLWLAGAGTTWALTGDVHGDFAAIRSLPLDRLRAENEDATLRSVFEHDYQFNLGISARVQTELRHGPFVLSASGHHGRYRSVDGYDRREAQVTLDTQGNDIVGQYALGFAIEPPGSAMHLGVSRESYWHQSHLNEFSETRRHTRLLLSLGLVF